ncbi:MAG: nucleotidyltransferase family protein [Alphaproteobacteria bacterium]|nr:nucleotidyltransferase family protein [Alphaproteobacteria bacterium]
MTIRTAMVLAAGLGLRMRPLTNDRPKPLVALAGRTLLDRALDRLDAAGVDHIVVNMHYRYEMIRDHLQGRGGIVLSYEEERLETGGGVVRALPEFGKNPFFVVNSDAVWHDGSRPALTRLSEAWDDARMDALLLLQPVGQAEGYEGDGDYNRTDDGTLRRRGDGETAPFLFAGVQILHPRLLAGAPDGAFSLNLLYDKAQAAGRLFGLEHDAEWFHVGTPEDLARTEARLAQLAGGDG